VSEWLVVCVQLPMCLCIHIPRTSWLTSGVAVKRFDHVGFNEVLDLAPYVYYKRGAAKLRAKTPDVDTTTRLVGGRSDGLSSTTYVRFVVWLLLSITLSFAKTIVYDFTLRPNVNLV